MKALTGGVRIHSSLRVDKLFNHALVLLGDLLDNILNKFLLLLANLANTVFKRLDACVTLLLLGDNLLLVLLDKLGEFGNLVLDLLVALSDDRDPAVPTFLVIVIPRLHDHADLNID